jgi:hypothetical protein
MNVVFVVDEKVVKRYMENFVVVVVVVDEDED